MKRRVIWYIRLLCQFSMEHIIGDENFCPKIMRKMGRPRIPPDLLVHVSRRPPEEIGVNALGYNISGGGDTIGSP